MISNRLRELRQKHKLSMQEVATELGVTRASVSKWELGLTQPELGRLELLARLYGTSVGFILGEAPDGDVVSYPVVRAASATKLLSTSSAELELFPSTRRLDGTGVFVHVDNDVFARAGHAHVVRGSMVLVEVDRPTQSGDICYVSNAEGQALFARVNVVGGRSYFSPLTPEYADQLNGRLRVIGVAVEAVTVTTLTAPAKLIKK